ncbi:MAG: 3-deoxy-manno-octulosonate cytidylyltransferase [Candidatus Omnitrophota bacterium]|nr:MAG: 3-deoxy-manno-octulosonate cytidylyltransferase [Candidatus Omnitrophota bacterium]
MKIGFLITARLKSTRLPFKILKDLNGKTVVERVIDRAKQIRDISKIVLCTSFNPQDKPLIDLAKKNSVEIFAGEENDVLKRFLGATNVFGLKYFLSITADNPLFSIKYSNLMVERLKKYKHDFIKIEGLPLGTRPYGLKTKALERVCNVKDIKDTEIWGYFFDRPEIFNVGCIKVKGRLKRPDLRLTLDYGEDYELINNVYSNITFRNTLELDKAIAYLDANSEIAKLNQGCIQRDLDRGIKDHIDSIFGGRTKTKFFIEKDKK